MQTASQRRRSPPVIAAIAVALFALCSFAAASNSLQGVVSDSDGAAIASADVVVTSGGRTLHAVTSPVGRFELQDVTPPASLTIQKPGFAPQTTTWNGEQQLDVVLRPAAIEQQVVVSATRTEMALNEIAASVSRIDAAELAATPALALDDALRQVPGFSLFRRTGSRTANPTSQGVSL